MSADSETEICNIALTRIGHQQITDIGTDTSKAGDLCRLQYPRLRDAMLRMHPWNFAIKRALLASDATAPVFEYLYAFPLPSDCLKVIRTSWEATGYSSLDSAVKEFWSEPTLPYRIENHNGRKALLANEATVSIEYVSKVTDTSEFDEHFTDVLAQRLAAEIAMALTDNQSFTKTSWDMYAIKLNDARTLDAQEGSARDIVDSSYWLTARR